MYEILSIAIIIVAFGMLVFLGYFLSNPPKGVK